MRPLSILAASLFIASAHAGQVFDGFEGGANPNGWQWNGGGSIVASGGHPGAWLGSGEITALGGALTAWPAPGTALADALASGELASVSLDFEQLAPGCDNPGQVGRFVLILTNTHGTADLQDDDFAYTIGEAVPDTFGSWSHVAFTIPVGATTLPRGWVGGHYGDPVHFADGVTWPDLIASIDRIDVDLNVPFLDHTWGCWNVGVDSIAVTYGGDEIFADGFDDVP